MLRRPVPGTVTLGRVLLVVESALWLLFGVLMFVGAIAILSAVSGGGGSVFPWAGAPPSSLQGGFTTIGVFVLVLGVAVVGMAGAGIWSAIAMGRLGGGARVTGIVLASLGAAVGILNTIGGFTLGYLPGSGGAGTIGYSTAVPGLVLLAVNVLIISALALNRSAQEAFRRPPPGVYAMAPPVAYAPPYGYPPPPQPYAYPPQQLQYPGQPPGYPAPPPGPPDPAGYPLPPPSP